MEDRYIINYTYVYKRATIYILITALFKLSFGVYPCVLTLIVRRLWLLPIISGIELTKARALIPP